MERILLMHFHAGALMVCKGTKKNANRRHGMRNVDEKPDFIVNFVKDLRKCV